MPSELLERLRLFAPYCVGFAAYYAWLTAFDFYEAWTKQPVSRLLIYLATLIGIAFVFFIFKRFNRRELSYIERIYLAGFVSIVTLIIWACAVAVSSLLQGYQPSIVIYAYAMGIKPSVPEATLTEIITPLFLELIWNWAGSYIAISLFSSDWIRSQLSRM